MVSYYVSRIHGRYDSMILDWESKINEVCTKLGIDPEIYSETEDLQEWMAKHLGFEDYATFAALPSPYEIINKKAFPMLPAHKSYEYPLMMVSIDLIIHDLLLLNDIEQIEFECQNFLKYIMDNFSTEIQIVSLRTMFFTKSKDLHIDKRRILFNAIKNSIQWNIISKKHNDLVLNMNGIAL